MAEDEMDKRPQRRDLPERPVRGENAPGKRQETDAEREETASLEDAPLGFVQVNTDDNQIEGNPLDDETLEDSLQVGTNADAVMDQIDDYTDDQEILDDFAERQMTNAGSEQLLEDLTHHHSRSPGITAGDVDADWEGSYQSGEETVGGTVATPDQDIVEELGEAAGITYEDDQELNTEDRIIARDTNRWELNPESTAEEEEELRGAGDAGRWGEDDGLDELE
jgi:hypothetical protein